MTSATIVLMVAGLLTSGAPGLVSNVAFAQTAPAQQASQPNTTPAPAAAPISPAPVAPKPCPAVLPGQSSPPPDCKPASKSKKGKGSPTADAVPASGPTRKVVRDGGASDTSSAISPDMSPQQAQQQRGRTTWLLGKTDENLKILASRPLNPAQQDTVHQVKRYVEDSEDATKNGDLQRAYTLANKARMLSADLVKH
ncbi:MAG TPA: hypothetical protein VK763_20545 [Terriglobales bacterium]|nr:hypothetical protein [Terriglobales bacterium]